MSISIKSRFRDPVSGLSHLAGALLGVFGLLYLVQASAERSGWQGVVPFAVFGAAVVFMYLASALYHLSHGSASHLKFLRRIDHTMIFLLIAGSYTPYCLIPLWGTPYGMPILVLIWVLALVGGLLKLVWLEAPRWLSTSIYVGMGWISLIAIMPLVRELSTSGLLGLFAGGLFYTFGAVIYALKRPNPFPPLFGFHEIWHLFVLAGTACHFYSVVTLL